MIAVTLLRALLIASLRGDLYTSRSSWPMTDEELATAFGFLTFTDAATVEGGKMNRMGKFTRKIRLPESHPYLGRP
jgi:hypothetical protein